MRSIKNTSMLGVAAVAVSLAAFTSVGCGDSDDADPTSLAGDPIIGGMNATNEVLNHTGAMVAVWNGTEPIEICTGTLIAPDVVVTAKHCVDIIPMVIDSGYRLAFAVGPDSTAPDDLVGVAGYDAAPGDEGGFVEMGRDVAVLFLDRAPNVPISPAEPRSLSEDRVGEAMVSLGYGDHGAMGAWDGRRRIGRETVAAVEGLAFEAMFGDYESFLEWWYTGEVSDEDYEEIIGEDPFVLEIYETTVLYPEHEAVTGVADGDTQSCYGDSGGPLARLTTSGDWVTYGVVSGGLSSLRSECDFGTVFSTFGPESLAFLRGAREWEDPCGDVTEEGSCLGGVATTCQTDLLEGTRTIQEEDCIAQGEQCVIVDDHAWCGTVVPAEYSRLDQPARIDFKALIREHFLFSIGVLPRWQR